MFPSIDTQGATAMQQDPQPLRAEGETTAGELSVLAPSVTPRNHYRKKFFKRVFFCYRVNS